MSEEERKQMPPKKTGSRRFLAIWLPILAILFTLSYLFYQYEVQKYFQLTGHGQTLLVQSAQKQIVESIEPVIRDLGFLARRSDFTCTVFDPSGQKSAPLQRLEQNLLEFADSHPEYDQIRILDCHGMERVRINVRAGDPQLVSTGDLQDKSNRYYFKETFNLGKGEVYMSPMDLNVEHGMVEVPLKPVIRFGQLLFDADDRKQGMIILNFKADSLLADLRSWEENQKGDIFLVNGEGYYLLSENAEHEWGFMLPERARYSLPAEYPEVWSRYVSREEAGQVIIDNDLWTFGTIYPLEGIVIPGEAAVRTHIESELSSTGSRYYWKLVTRVQSSLVDEAFYRVRLQILVTLGILSLAIGYLSYVLSQAQLRRKEAKTALQAANRELENKVRERTRELEEKNSDLRQEVQRRQEVERFLIESETRYRSIMDAMNDGVYIVGADYKVKYLNRVMKEIGGDGCVGLRCHKTLYKQDSKCSWCVFDKVMHGRDTTYEMQSPVNNRYYHVVCSPIQYGDETPGQLTILRDITDLKETQQALAKSEQQYATLLNAMREGVVVLDLSEVITYCNDRFADMLGYDGEELIGRFASTLFDEKNKEIFQEQIELRKKGIAEPYEIAWLMKSGDLLDSAVSPAILSDESGNYKGFFGLVTDISGQKAMQAEKEQLEKRLAQSQKMEAIGTLAGGIAHDFNNILSAILGYTELAQVGCDKNSTYWKYLDKVLTAGQRAKGLVQQILAFSRQTNTQLISFQPASIVKESVKMLRPSLPTTIRIEQDIDPNTGLIEADPTQFNQILMNLCTNAYHAMEEEGGTLTIRLTEKVFEERDLVLSSEKKPGRYVLLSIEDTGKGIPKEIQDKIYDPYFTTKKSGKGTGMGLAIVHGLVKDFGGIITMYTEEGEGTVFNIFFPVVQGEEAEVEDTSSFSFLTGDEHVLLVDDEAALAQMGKEMLESLGYTVTVTTSSREALQRFEQSPDKFDVVVTDQTMPELTGAQLSQKLLAIRPSVPIILCTGFSTVISEKEAHKIGIREFALKPVPRKELSQLLRKVLDT